MGRFVRMLLCVATRVHPPEGGSHPVTSRRILPRLVVLLALAVVAAACSGGGALSHADYQKKLDQIGAELKKQSDAFSGAGDIKSEADLKKLIDPMRQGADATDHVAQELDGLTPPADAAKANQALVDNLPKVADDFRKFADAIDSGDIAKLTSIGKQFQAQTAPGLKEVTDAIAQLKQLGYTIQNG